MAKLSIIVPVYNMREHLERCLFSVRNTVRIPYEVIVVDDGSSADEQILRLMRWIMFVYFAVRSIMAMHMQ